MAVDEIPISSGGSGLPADVPADFPAESWEGCSPEELRQAWKLPAVHLYARLGSTNDVARTLAAGGAPHGTLVVADEQFAGRGRAGRSWHSPPGVGLWCSFLAAPPAADRLAAIPLLVGLRVADALDPWMEEGIPVRIKWPNDLLVGQGKVGGILCESSWAGDAVAQFVIGIGINLLQRADEFPSEIRDRAASLRQPGGRPISRFDVASAVVARIRPLLAGTAELDLEEFTRRDALRGRGIEVLDPATGRVLAAGTANGVARDGALVVLDAEGGRLLVRSGTIVVAGTAS